MAAQRKTWQEKFDNGKEPHIEVLPKPFAGAPAGSKMLISTPAQVAREIGAIPYGQTVPLRDFRALLARAAGADVACPTSTSIFVRIAAEVACEALSQGRQDVTPFWRVVDPNSELASKLSCGPAFIRAKRAEESA